MSNKDNADPKATGEENSSGSYPPVGYDPAGYYDPGDQVIVPEQARKASTWLVTFSDVTALMLTFFVLLYSMSKLPDQKWNSMIPFIANEPSLQKDTKLLPVELRTITRINLVEAFPPAYLHRILEKKLQADPLLSRLRLTNVEDAVILSLLADDIFTGNGTNLSKSGSTLLARLAILFGQFGNRLDIYGHSDPTPLPVGSIYEDKWASSLGQAMAVAQALNKNGREAGYTVFGRADTDYHFIDPALPEAKRHALARRIDIIIRPEARGQ